MIVAEKQRSKKTLFLFDLSIFTIFWYIFPGRWKIYWRTGEKQAGVASRNGL